MKIGILQTDSVLDQFQAQYGNYPDMFIRLLRRVSADLTFSVFDVQQGHYPTHINDCDAYLITGSKASVYEPLPWIATLQDFVVQLDRSGKKLIAVCFGHQLVAQAFGGVTEKSAKGWGVGVHSITVKRPKSWMNPALETINIVVSHQDQVSRLPEGSELIAGSEFCPNSLFQFGKHIITIQGHPEFSKDYAKAMMINRRQKISAEQFEQAMDSWQKPVDDLIVAKWFLQFITQSAQ